MKRPRWAIGLVLLALPACATPAPAPAPVAAAPAPAPCMQTGTASWYRPKASPKPTASGETTGAGALVAAHPTLPFGTQVTVTVHQGAQHRRLARRRHPAWHAAGRRRAGAARDLSAVGGGAGRAAGVDDRGGVSVPQGHRCLSRRR